MHTSSIFLAADAQLNRTVKHSTTQQSIKHLLEISFVVLTMPLWFPLCALIYILIWFEDKKNPLFLHERIGKNGRKFKTFKFRTMVPNAEAVLRKVLEENDELRQEWETFYKLRKDPRITKIGGFLRRTSLDELPQLFNVIRGEMALVGPRPLTTYHLDALPKEVCNLRELVKPGITGMWQVSGRSDSGNEGMKQWDPYYVQNWSLGLDFTILYRTIFVVLKREGAY